MIEGGVHVKTGEVSTKLYNIILVFLFALLLGSGIYFFTRINIVTKENHQLRSDLEALETKSSCLHNLSGILERELELNRLKMFPKLYLLKGKDLMPITPYMAEGYVNSISFDRCELVFTCPKNSLGKIGINFNPDGLNFIDGNISSEEYQIEECSMKFESFLQYYDGQYIYITPKNKMNQKGFYQIIIEFLQEKRDMYLHII